jgi:ribosomal protein S18 acetylase RimI-like enzyme
VSGEITFAHGWRPGVIGDIVRLHALYYAQHWRLEALFEARVAAGLGAFLESYDEHVSRLFTAHVDDRLAGSLTIDGSSDPDGVARLRWFIVADEARGRGLGKKLLQMAMDFLAETKQLSCYLSTFDGLDTARALYEHYGFRLTREATESIWGRSLRMQRFEWKPGR